MFSSFTLAGLGLAFRSSFTSSTSLSSVAISRGVGSRRLSVSRELTSTSLSLSIFLTWSYLRSTMKSKKSLVAGGMSGFSFRIRCNSGFGGDSSDTSGDLGCDFRLCFSGTRGLGMASGSWLIAGLVVPFVILVLPILDGPLRLAPADLTRPPLLLCGLQSEKTLFVKINYIEFLLACFPISHPLQISCIPRTPHPHPFLKKKNESRSNLDLLVYVYTVEFLI